MWKDSSSLDLVCKCFNASHQSLSRCRAILLLAPGQTQSEASAPPQSSEPEASSAGATVASKSTEPPSAPSSILEALQQRLEKYEGAAAQAKEEGNGSKARRMGRITKVFCVANHVVKI